MMILRLAILFGLASGLAAAMGGPLGRAAAEAVAGLQTEMMR